jgi:hypothetical protein
MFEIRSISIRSFMVPVKIECDCGQHYAFEVEPVNGRMPAPIACPGCGADGTVAANDVISRALTGIPVPEEPKLIIPPKPVPNLHLAQASSAPETVPAPIPAVQSSLHLASNETSCTPVPASRASDIRAKGALHAAQFGIVSREQAQVEAKAKILWGETPEAVVNYLMLQGFSHAEAASHVNELFKARLAETRANGVRRTVIGGAMMCVPIIALIVCLSIHFMPLKLMGIAFAIGAWGLIKVITGIFMIVSPKTEAGDIADQ